MHAALVARRATKSLPVSATNTSYTAYDWNRLSCSTRLAELIVAVQNALGCLKPHVTLALPCHSSLKAEL